ncbi:hypothetical protein Bbelb_401640 [Branchiostoma belcheri]|nr:hypothetical protein Bbelb_401640 [Branchiostoma belcheri]
MFTETAARTVGYSTWYGQTRSNVGGRDCDGGTLKGDGTAKLLVYRKSTHTDQYLNFQSRHPLHQKLGVIRTLMDRYNSVVTEEEDKERETQHIKRALILCGYPQWTFQKKQEAQKEEKKSAVTDHVDRNNCVIDWEGARVIDREDNRRIRWIKEAVWIRKSTPVMNGVMNRDEGGYKLSHVWDCILAAKAPPTLAINSGELQNSSQKL